MPRQMRRYTCKIDALAGAPRRALPPCSVCPGSPASAATRCNRRTHHQRIRMLNVTTPGGHAKPSAPRHTKQVGLTPRRSIERCRTESATLDECLMSAQLGSRCGAEWHDAFAVRLSCARRCFTGFLLAKSDESSDAYARGAPRQNRQCRSRTFQNAVKTTRNLELHRHTLHS